MPKLTGLYTKDPITTFDESLRQVAALAQKPAPGDKARPLVDLDFNLAQMQTLTLIRRLSQFGSRSGAFHYDAARIGSNASANDFYVHGAGTTFDVGSVYNVAGLPAHIPFVVGTVNFKTSTLTDAKWIHRKFTAITTTVLTDSAANWPTNALVDRTLTVFNNNGTSVQTQTITANTASTITVGSPFLLGAAATQIDDTATTGTGTAYRVNPSTPTAAARTDAIWLDVYLDEIAAEKAGQDLDNDPGLNHNIQGTTLESMRRLRIVQSLFVEEGFAVAGDKFVTGAGSLSEVDSDDDVFSWTDFAGMKHYGVRVALLKREQNDADIDADMIEDHRIFAGRQAFEAIRQNTDAAFDQAIVSSGGFNPTKTNSTTVTIDPGQCIQRGEWVSLAGSVFTKPTAVSTWSASTWYRVYVDNRRRVVVSDSGPTSGSATAYPTTAVKICTFQTDASSLVKDFTSANNFSDDRIFIDNFPAKFAFDKNNRISVDVSLATTKALLWKDSAGTQTAGLNENSGVTLEAITAGSSVKMKAGTATVSVKDTTPETVVIETEPTGFVDAQSNAAVAPLYWRLTETRHNKVVSPGFKFGDATGETALTAKKLWVPATMGWARASGSAAATGVVQSYDYFSFEYNAAVSTEPYLVIPLPVAKGVRVNNPISIKLWNKITANSITIQAKLYTRNDSGASESPSEIAASSATAYSTSNPNEQSLNIDPANLLKPVAQQGVFVGIWVTATTLVAGNGLVKVLGVELDVDLRAVGDYAVSTDYTYPIVGM